VSQCDDEGVDGGRVEIHPATVDRFADVATVLSPKKLDSPACWCLTYRLRNAENSGLRGQDRPERLRRFCESNPPPGLVAYVDGEPAGWCSVAPRSTYHRLTVSRTIPRLDDVDVWSIVCFVVRPTFRRRGLAHDMLSEAVAFARSHDAPAIEGYPADPQDGRLSASFAFTGTTSLFEAAGFRRVVQTGSVSGGAARWLVRLDLI
jgi:GNAT superfamily N-acetyltransferase